LISSQELAFDLIRSDIVSQVVAPHHPDDEQDYREVHRSEEVLKN